MLRSRLAIFGVVFASILCFAGYASADVVYPDYSDGYTYGGGGIYIAPVPAAPMVVTGAPGYYHGCYAHRHHYKRFAHRMMHRGCPMYHGFYVCTKYTLEITPIHRDVACSQWVFTWKPMRYGWHRRF